MSSNTPIKTSASADKTAGQHASSYHSTDRSSARVMAQAAYQPTDEEYAEYERRAEARKAAKAERQADKADKAAEAAEAASKSKNTGDDSSSIFSFRSLSSTTGLLRKSEKK